MRHVLLLMCAICSNNVFASKSLYDLYSTLYVCTQQIYPEFTKPNLIISDELYVQATALGYPNHTIVITNMAVQLLPHTQLAFVLAHELGHYVLGHTLIAEQGHKYEYSADLVAIDILRQCNIPEQGAIDFLNLTYATSNKTHPWPHDRVEAIERYRGQK